MVKGNSEVVRRFELVEMDTEDLNILQESLAAWLTSHPKADINKADKVRELLNACVDMMNGVD